MKNFALFFIISLASFIAIPALANTEIKTFPARSLKYLNITNPAGNLTLEAFSKEQEDDLKNAEASYELTKTAWSSDCELDLAETKDSVSIKVKKKGKITKQQPPPTAPEEGLGVLDTEESTEIYCRLDIKATVPRITYLKANMSLGDITTNNIVGNFDVNLGKGHINLNQTQIPRLNLNLGEGDVNISAGPGGVVAFAKIIIGRGNYTQRGNFREADIFIGSGDANLNYFTKPDTGHLKLETGLGNANIYMPRYSKLKTVLETGFGNKINKFANNPHAAYQVNISTGSGNLSLLN